MNRPISALFAAFEALLVVAIGIAIPLVPLTVLWAAQYGFALDWGVFWRASVDTWLVGHGADLIVTLDAATAKASGLAGSKVPFVIGIAALGFALLTVTLAMRAGRRIAQTDYRLLGELVAVITVAALSVGVTLSALHPLVRPSIVQGVTLPPLIFALGLLIQRVRDGSAADSPVGTRWARLNPVSLALARSAARGGAMAATLVIGIAALVLAVMLLVNYAQIITLYEGLHTEVLGGAAVTLAEIAFVPNLVIWVASWLIGPGFAIGIGSSVSPLGTSLGPIPAIPIFGALPAGAATLGFVAVLVPVVVGFLCGALFRPRLVASLGRAVVSGLGMGLTAGITLGLLSWFSAGAAGPGRLASVGPNPWFIALWAAIEIGVSATMGVLAASRSTRDPHPPDPPRKAPPVAS